MRLHRIVGHFEDGLQGTLTRSVARAIGEEESKEINEAQRKDKQPGGMTHHVNGGRPGRQARSRAPGSIGVPPVFPIRVPDDDQKLGVRTSPRSHSPISSRHSATQARRLFYHRLGVMPPLRPVGASSLLEMPQLQGRCLQRPEPASGLYRETEDDVRSKRNIATLYA